MKNYEVRLSGGSIVCYNIKADFYLPQPEDKSDYFNFYVGSTTDPKDWNLVATFYKPSSIVVTRN